MIIIGGYHGGYVSYLRASAIGHLKGYGKYLKPT